MQPTNFCRAVAYRLCTERAPGTPALFAFTGSRLPLPVDAATGSVVVIVERDMGTAKLSSRSREQAADRIALHVPRRCRKPRDKCASDQAILPDHEEGHSEQKNIRSKGSLVVEQNPYDEQRRDQEEKQAANEELHRHSQVVLQRNDSVVHVGGVVTTQASAGCPHQAQDAYHRADELEPHRKAR